MPAAREETDHAEATGGRDEVKSEVEEKLRKQRLTKPLSEKEMDAFCEAMIRNL